MKKYIWSIAILILAACNGNDYDESEGIIVSPYYITVEEKVNVSSEAGVVELKIKANCSWTITKDANWLTLSSSKETGNQSIILEVNQNTTNSERTALITVKNYQIPAKTITIVQAKPDASTQIPGRDDNLPPS